MLETERLSSTSDPTMERELICLRHLHEILREVASDLGFDAVGLLHTHVKDYPIFLTGFGRLCQAMSDHLGHV